LRYRRGQIFAYDLVFALMAVSFLIWYAITASNALADRISYVEENNRIAEVAQSAAGQLVESAGDPSDWSDFRANSIGLSESRGVLDGRKVETFFSLAGTEEGYDEARALLSLNRQGGAYLFNLRVVELDGREIHFVGPSEPAGAAVSSVSRTALLEGRPVRLLLRVWGVQWGVGP
jgi:hypothetical protein